MNPCPAAFAPTCLAVALALGAVPCHGQERPEEKTVFSGETTVVAVELPVEVLADGEPVRGLTADDFRVFEGRQPRPLTGFEVVDLSVRGAAAAANRAAAPTPATPAPALSVPPAGRRHFLLLFDLSFTRAGYLARAIDGARHLVREGLHPSDLVGVAFYSPSHGVDLALQFTPDRDQVERVLDAFASLLDGGRRGAVAAEAAEGSAADPLGLTVGTGRVALAEVGEAAGVKVSEYATAAETTSGGGRSSGVLEDIAERMDQVVKEEQATEVTYLADNVRELARRLRAIPGPKHLVLLSQGFDVTLLETGAGHDLPVAGAWVKRSVDAMVRELKESGWVIHGADLKGIEHPFEAGTSANFKGGLFYLSEETGGTLVENTNDLAVGLEHVLERTSVTYVLTFQSDSIAVDGAFHPIRVELVGGPPGARLVHRSGYFAPRPASDLDPFELRASAAERILAGEEVSGMPARFLATAFDYDGGRARVPVLLQISDADLVGGGAEEGAPLEVYVYAFDRDGRVAGFLAQSVDLGADAAEPRAESLAGVKLTGTLELPPGSYELRALVRSRATGREAVRTLALELPDPAAGPRLLPPVIVQGPTERWLVAELGSTDGRHPFSVEGKSLAPAAAPVLAPGQPARLLLPGVAIAGEGVRLETRIVADGGTAAKAGRLDILGRRPSAPGQPDLLVARLDPSGLPAGSYTLEVALAGSGRWLSAPFRVGD